MQPSTRPPRALVRLAGALLIGASWAVAGYLLVFHAVVAALGAERLYEWLGQDAYNRWIATGGVSLVLGVLLLGALYVLPFVALALAAKGMARLAAPAPWRARCFAILLWLGAIGMVGLHLSRSPGSLPDMLWHALAGDTVYADGYSEARFRALRIGMSRQAVTEALGEPLERQVEEDGSESWSYARTPASNSYWVREVEFAPGGTVRRIWRDLYVD